MAEFRAGRREIGGAEEDRTPDLLIANETLSQLSYGPTVGRPRIVASAFAAASEPQPSKRVFPDRRLCAGSQCRTRKTSGNCRRRVFATSCPVRYGQTLGNRHAGEPRDP